MLCYKSIVSFKPIDAAYPAGLVRGEGGVTMNTQNKKNRSIMVKSLSLAREKPLVPLLVAVEGYRPP